MIHAEPQQQRYEARKAGCLLISIARDTPAIAYVFC